VIVLSNKPKL